MTQTFDYDLAVIGSGPGGYVAAIRASQLGMKSAIIEKDKPGGVCLNIGCIPTKAIIQQAQIYRSARGLEQLGASVDLSGFDYGKVYKKSRKAANTLSRGVRYLLKKNKIKYIEGNARLVGRNLISVNDEKQVRAKNIIIATGSRPRSIPGFEIDEEKIISSNGALRLKKLPQKILIMGAGSIGVEFAYILNSFGVDVHLVEVLDNILPLEDTEVTSVLARIFKKRKVKISTGTRVESINETKDGLTVTLKDREGKQQQVETDKILVAVGRAPNSEGLGLEDLGIETERGFIKVGDYYRTTVDGVFAIGDVIDTPQLAHVASREGEIAVEHIAGLSPPKKLDLNLIPAGTYSEPQLASFGITEDQAKKEGINYKKATFPYRGNGKSVIMEETDGIIKILYYPESKEILGASAVGPAAIENIHELLLAKKAELLPEDVATTVHAHPTLSEVVMEVARAAEGGAIHA